MAAAVLLCDDVLDMERVLLLMLLTQAAVFAAIARTLPHLKPRRVVHESSGLAFQKQSGLEFEDRHHLACKDVAPVFGLLIAGEPAFIGLCREFLHPGRFSGVGLDLNDVRRRFRRKARAGGVEHLFEAGKGIHTN